MESILMTIKKLLGIPEEVLDFDTDIIIHINTVLGTLNQLGVGPEEGFVISDQHAAWDDFITSKYKLESVKTYIYLKVKLLFDPPQNSSVTASIKEQIAELEWRINNAN